MNTWKKVGNFNVTLINSQIIKQCDIIFLAVKPQYLDEALSTSSSDGKNDQLGKLFISIIVGIPLDILDNVNIIFYFV